MKTHRQAPTSSFVLTLLSLLLLLLAAGPRPILAQTFSEAFNDPDFLTYGSDWGDYDNDGDLDLILTGFQSDFTILSTIYRNDGNGTFTDINAGLTGTHSGQASWGDYDNDGDLDLALTGQTASGLRSLIYRNDGNNTFTDINAGLTGVVNSEILWGDYDNDGDLDLLLTGLDESNVAQTILYRNDAGTFTDIGAGLTGTTSSASAWGDYDNDGDLDLVIIGQTTGNNATIYRNGDGNGGAPGVFTSMGNLGLPAFNSGDVAWGDADNDGDLDLLVVGGNLGAVYRNTDLGGGNRTFEDFNAGLTGLSLASVVWMDYDADGDLDALINGRPSEGGGLTQLFRNDGTDGNGDLPLTGLPLLNEYQDGSVAAGDYDGDGKIDLLVSGVVPQYRTTVYRNITATSNTLPSAPTGLTAAFSGTTAVLSWNPGTDNLSTPQDALTYNLRVGTTPGGQDVLAPMSDPATGQRRIHRLGNASSGTSWTLRGLDPTATYYWSVQTLDHSLAGSPFPPEQSFVETPLAATPMSFDYGSVDVGTTVSQTFTVTNTRTTNAIEVFAEVPMEGNAAGDFIITSGGGAFFLDAGESRDVTVAFTPSNDGFRNATLRFAFDSGQGQLDVPLSGLGVALPMLTVTATDNLFEDQVEIRWEGITGDNFFYRVERDGESIALVASTETMHLDVTGDPGVTYTYCVVVMEGEQDMLTGCDDGSRKIFRPTGFKATDGTNEDEVRLTWADRSEVEDGYLLSRDGEQALQFDGTTNHAVTADAIDLSGSFTIAFRARRTRTGVTEAVISHGTSPDYEGFQLGFDSANRFFFWFRNDVLNTTTTYTDTDWHHYAITYDAPTQMRAIYVDGVLAASNVSAQPYLGNGPLYMGRLSWGSANFFAGGLDEVRLWSTARTAGQIAAGRSTLPSGLEPDLASYWPLDAGTGTTAMDVKGGNHAAFVDMDATSWIAAPAFNLSAFIARNTASYLDRMSVPGAVYSYTLAAVLDPNGDRRFTQGTDFASETQQDDGWRAFVTPPGFVAATDGQYTDRVRITWTDQSEGEDAFSIYRDGSLLGTVPAESTLFDDLTAASEVTYTYCVTSTIGGVESTQVCDEGMRGGLAPPEDVAATIDTFDDKVQVTWDIAAGTEDGFEILRDAAVIDTVGAGTAIYNDTAALQGTDHTYCVRAYSAVDPDNPSVSAEVCDNGRRSPVLPPINVAATDGDFEDQVEMTWENVSTTAMLVNLYRVDPESGDTTLIKSVAPTQTLFADLFSASDTPTAYCAATYTLVNVPEQMQQQVVQLAVQAATDFAIQQKTAAGTINVADGESLNRLVASTAQLHSRIEDVVVANRVADGQMENAQASIVTSAKVCDIGSRSINPPTEVAATYEDAETHVAVTWTDNSEVDDGFHIYRSDGVMLDGTDDFIEVPRDPALEVTDRLTLEAWIKPANFSTDYAGIVTNIFDTGSTESGYGLLLRSTGSVDFALATANGPISYGCTASLPVPDKWYHVAGTYDGANRRVYVDGKLETTCPTTGAMDYTPINDLSIGMFNDDNDFLPFEGVIRDVRLWSVARTAAEINTNRDALLDGDEAGLVAYWPLNEIGGTTALDRTGSNNGILRGTAQLGSRISTVGPLRTRYSDYTSTPGVDYVYGVSAYDANGESRRNTDTGRRILEPAKAFRATDGTFEQQIVLSWSDESRAEDGYRLYRDGVEIATTAANATTYTDNSGITFGMIHAYTIEAFDAYGVSETVGDAGSTVILPPTDVSASDTYTDKVVIAWLDVSGMETGYEVRRDGVAIATTAANVTTYTDTAVSAGQSYTYCVATKGSGTTTSVEDCDEGSVPGVAVATDFTPELVFTASSAAVNDEFGYGVAVDGDWAIVGARFTDDQNRGGAYFYERNGARWEQRDFVTAPAQVDAQQGFSVDISGNFAVIGAPCDIGTGGESGAVYVYELVGTTWQQVQKLVPPDANPAQIDLFGRSVSIDGDWILVGSPGWDGPGGSTNAVGRVHFYKRGSDGTWTRQDTENYTGGGDPVFANFGSAVSINSDWAIVGGPGADAAGVDGGFIAFYKLEGNDWVVKASFGSAPAYRQGTAVAMGDGWAAVGAPGATSCSANCGEIYILERNSDGSWATRFTRQGTVGFGFFGNSIAMSGNTVVTGTNNNRVHAFTYENGWKDANPATYGGTGNFGTQPPSLGISNNWVIFGAPLASNESNVQTGAVYMSAILRSPEDVQASDGGFEDRIQVTWTDLSEQEGGFHVYRREADGQLNLVGTTAPEAELFDDFSASAGGSYEYCVKAFLGNKESGLADTSCEFGWRPANGTISGRVATLAGGGTEDVQLCLSPSPNRGLLFDNVAGEVTIGGPLAAPFPMPTSFTIEFWAKRDAINAWDIALSTGTGGDNTAIYLGFTDTNAFTFNFWTNGLNTPQTYTDTDWHHWAVTFDGNSLNRSIYRDGDLVATDVAPGPYVGTGVLHIGYWFTGGADHLSFGGQLDELRIWSSVRESGDIKADKDRQLTGQESDLVGYWAFDEGARRVTADLTGNGNNGLMKRGVHWTDMGAFDICATTNIEGNYSLSGLQYGESTEFTLTPNHPVRAFEPGFKSITLSTESPVQNEVAFIDNTAFTVAGIVQFAGTECPVPDVEILVDGTLKGTTESDGTFSVSVDPSIDNDDLRRIEPRLDNPQDGADFHTFTPDETDLFIDADQFGVTFADQKTRLLTGTFSGSCNTDIGTATVRIFTEDGCFVREIEVDGSYREALPPQAYLVQVIDVQTDSDRRADIIQFFDDLGAVPVDLTMEADTLDLTYRAPLSVAISGLPNVPMCPSGTIDYLSEDNDVLRSLPVVPVLQEATPLNLSILAFEDYGDPDDPSDDAATHCPVDEGTLTVYDGIADLADTPMEFAIDSTGTVLYPSVVGAANIFAGAVVDGIDRSFQKSITAIAEVTGRPAATTTEWGIVEGVRPRTSTFVSATSQEFPLLILHDPPGDASYAYIEEGTSLCSSFEFTEAFALGLQSDIRNKIGFKTLVGFGVYVETEAVGGLNISTGLSVGGAFSNSENFCVTATERYSTASGSAYIGQPSDVYVGTALNYIFAQADELEFEANTCAVTVTETLTGGLNQEAPFATTFAYTEQYIEDFLIPQMQELIEQDHPEKVNFQLGIQSWQRYLTENDSLRQAVQDLDPAECQNSIGEGGGAIGLIDCNRSFSSGATVASSVTRDSTWSSTSGAVETLFFNIGGGFTGFIAGSGGIINLTFTSNAEFTQTRGTEESATMEVGYVLEDDDLGDFFSVNIGENERYGTFAFGLKSGTSSWPHEPGTQSRDQAILAINPPQRNNVAADETATFTMSLTNAGESQEGREYILRTIHGSNPGGAILSANGAPLHNGLSFVIDAQQTQEVTLGVKRGPTKYAYEDLQVQLYPSGEYPIWIDGGLNFNGKILQADTVSFNVYYDAPCSDINILRPQERWYLNASSDPLNIILNEFNQEVSESERVEKLGLQYRLLGIENNFPDGQDDGWRPAVDVLTSELSPSADSWTATWMPPQEGEYELRAYTTCPISGTAYSDLITGTFDTARPKRFGTPQPADQILHLGDDIAVTYNEPLDCESISTQGQYVNAELAYVDGPDAGTVIDGSEAVCRDNRLILAPPITFDWAAAEGLTLEARLLTNILDGDLNPVVITDLAGNAISEAITWQFVVARSAFSWQPLAVETTVNRYTVGMFDATLVNGRDAATAYTLADVPTWLTPSATSGTLAAGETRTVSFTIADTLDIGTYAATLTATTDQGPALLDVTVTVADLQQQAIALNAGWTWFSMNRTPNSAQPDSVLRGLMTDGGDLLKSQTAFSLFDQSSGSWVGSLGTLTPTSAYQVKLTQGGPLVVSGEAADLNTPITVNVGWNWIGYLPQEPRPVNDALASLTPTNGDLIKSQFAFAEFDGTNWVGALTQMEPGQGYMLFSQAGGTLTYGPAAMTEPGGDEVLASVRAMASASERATALAAEERGPDAPRKVVPGEEVRADDNRPELALTPSAYQHSMTLIGHLTFDGEPLDDPRAQVWLTDVDGSVRGLAQPRYVEALGEHRLFLMLHSDAEIGEAYAVHVYDPATERTVTLNQYLAFEADRRVGSISEPLAISAETEGYKAAKAAAELPTEYALAQNYPNPFNPTTTIHYELPEASQVSLVVYDVLGREVLRLVDTEQSAGRYDVAFDASRLASGVYLYRIEAGTFRQTHTMTLMK